MSGAMQSEYRCNLVSWEIFLSSLRRADVFINESDTADSQSTFLEIHRSPVDPAGIWLEKADDPDDPGNCAHVEMHWHTPNEGSDNRSLLKLALQLEAALIEAGAVCSSGEVRPFAAKIELT